MRFLLTICLSLTIGWTLAGCVDESNLDVAIESHMNDKSDASVADDVGVCAVAQSKQPIPARAAALVDAPRAATRTIFVDDLFNVFASQCGGCHIDVGLGNYQTSRGTFADVVDQVWVDSLRYNNEKTVMPPPSVGGKLFKDRPIDDPSNELADQLQAWLDQGRPRDVFHLSLESSNSDGPYRLDKKIADELTNIGNCIPEKSLYARDKATMAAMDVKFATMTSLPAGKGTRAQRIGLPLLLSDTDLTTFDSRELAKRGVIAFATTYPQWIDPDSRALRHVRVPLGESIVFNSTSQQFTIPADTRFYRTIVQRIIDEDGSERWRKMETQLILAWPNSEERSGYKAITSLYGTYMWNDDESQATLVTDPYRNGEPFRDHVVTYISDEVKAAQVLSTNPPNITYALRNVRAMRSYGIPGSWRCGQCHVGSPTQDFVLGFQPLQIARRNLGESGVIEEAGSDELSQLSRFIELGLITGITSPDEVLPLEKSEGTRTPRNDYELKAQGYLYGNCSHCHNPQGDVSIEVPELQTLLDFLPSKTGGVFQFPLERYSPRTQRAGGGPTTSVDLPYITPSIMDLGPSGDWTTTFLAPKCTIVDTAGVTQSFPLMAPWRSLIYRGVDTPFTYSDDLALVPHMPMNTQSFDCRAPRIIGDWMVSIPSVLKTTATSEYGIVEGGFVGGNCVSVDSSPQPYREVTAGHTGYKTAAAAVAERMSRYHNSPAVPTTVGPTNENPNPVMPSKYNFCPDNYDIYDPQVLKDPDRHPVPTDSNIVGTNGLAMPRDGVPDHAHWVILDTTQIPGDWAPRRPDWQDILVSQKFPPLTETGNDLVNATIKRNEEIRAVDIMHTATLSDAIRTLATTDLPLGLWQVRPNCDFGSVRNVASYGPTSTSAKVQYPAWVQAKVSAGQLTGSEPVYSTTPGEMIHNMICANCHGTLANSSGQHASVLSEITGGRANVTNLHDGIMNLDNRQRVFVAAPQSGGSIEDWAARYFSWMALGGTKQTIPGSLLALVANTEVLGSKRPLASPPNDANMLASAQDLCGSVLPVTQQFLDGPTSSDFVVRSQDASGLFSFEGGMFEASSVRVRQTSLVYDNGDALLWEQVCSTENPPPVRAFLARLDAGRTNVLNLSLSGVTDFYAPEKYGANPVANHRGQVISEGIAPDNYFPWCIRQPDNDNDKAAIDGWIGNHLANAKPLPYCPATDKDGNQYISRASGGITGDAHLDREQILRWTVRGAVNAGFVTYVYLNQLASGDLAPTPAYDHCEELSQ